ncbi:chitin-binding type-2 domain-containing protein [Trichonephila inaurata madagascariensis]|uniref:Chitin-binding type-2 domain-containing protein n=1 Tax=Trichonephila inaurata madagascariensis TaxID=2747483 RepID=A0A8X7CTN7_9ARAC|nr:chitin-binding type-2 domain-containing protein [Trichonephila inaurata madagascariensis]
MATRGHHGRFQKGGARVCITHTEIEDSSRNSRRSGRAEAREVTFTHRSSCRIPGVGTLAEERVKRQASYSFPGPRSDRALRPQAQAAPVYVEEQDEGEVYPRRQFQAQPVQPQYAPQPQARAQAPVAPAPQPAYEAPRQAAASPRSSHGDAAPRRRASSSSGNRANKYGSAPQQSLNGHEEEPEEEQGPDPLTLLLQDSQFTCGGKQDGYYADDSVNCQVFHYCVGGAKHSWMCPENTVFHQVHLNCVPDAQDICAQSQKFHFVNEYLYKPVDYEGPNNTARYSQRYYPDGYVVGDPLVAPQEQRRAPAPQPQPQPQAYAPPAAPPRAQPRQVAPAPPPSQPTYRAPAQPAPQPTYRAPAQPAPQQTYRAPAQPAAQSRPASRPSRPLESYPVEAPPNYRASAPARPTPPPGAYRVEQPQQAPPQASYREAAAAQQAHRGAQPQSQSDYSSEEYQPQPQPQARRPAAAAPQRPTAAYAPPRQQHRAANARASAGYQPYASNQAAGVHYDEDY